MSQAPFTQVEQPCCARICHTGGGAAAAKDPARRLLLLTSSCGDDGGGSSNRQIAQRGLEKDGEPVVFFGLLAGGSAI
eukprot:COSAG01_NODE_9257_length_2501_cov_3.696087_3_plen_78_part_00